ncbi:MAG: DUF4287 domain-containing protein [Acidobacteria bacterium]|nr:DUF4287 domain-containing protein [Acidobacteriota bacterium]
MNAVDKATETQLKNIEAKTGKSRAELLALARGCGLSKHGEIRDYLKKSLGLGHGDANTITHFATQPAAPAAGDDGIYTGAKAGLKPVHEELMAKIAKFGEFEIAPKKGYVSLRRKKQFAMIGPATNSQIEVGLNAKSLVGGERLKAVPPGGMCQYKVRLASRAEVDAELMNWLRTAFDAAG